MTLQDFKDYCLSKKGVEESFPFEDNTLVFRVQNTMFAATNVKNFRAISLRISEPKSRELNKSFSSIVQGSKINNEQWNTIQLQENISIVFIKEWIDEAYNYTLNTLTKKEKAYLEAL